MITGSVQLSEKQKEVESALSELDKSETELNNQEKQLEDGEKALLALPAQKTALETQKDSIDQALAAVSTLTAGQVEQLNQAIAQLEQVLGLGQVQEDVPDTEVTEADQTQDETAGLIENQQNLTKAAQDSAQDARFCGYPARDCRWRSAGGAGKQSEYRCGTDSG